MFPNRIETDRLTLLEFSRENVDIDELYARFGVDAPHVGEIFNQIPDDPLETAKDAVDMLERAQSKWQDNEAAMYAVSPAADEEGAEAIAGYAHLWMDWSHRKAELGLLLDKPFWGREYATEIYLALTETAFGLHGIEHVVIGHPASNTNSRRSIEKFIEEAGGQFDGTIPNNVRCGDELWDSRRYSVSAEGSTVADR